MTPTYYGLDQNTLPALSAAPGFDAATLVWWIVVLAVLAFAAVLAVHVLRAILRRRHARYDMATLLVTVPRFATAEEQKAEATKERVQEAIAAAEAFFSMVGGMKSQRGFKTWLLGHTDEWAFEIVCLRKVIRFYVTVPRASQNFLEQSLAAAWPSANVEPVEDYNIFTPRGVILGSYLTLKRPGAFPIKTYRKLDKDPLNALTNAIAKLPETEGAAFQFLVRSAPPGWRTRGINIASDMKQGMTMSEAIAGHKKSKAGLAELSGLKEAKEAPEHRLSPLEEQVVQGLEEKASKAGMEVCVRAVASGDTAERAQATLANMLNAFAEYNVYEYGNSFKKTVPRSKTRLVSGFIERVFDERMRGVFNAEEMASLWHLPLPWTETPNIQWLTARRGPAPVNVPGPSEGDIELGYNLYRGSRTPVWMKLEDRERHMYLIGKSGSGKTATIAQLAVQDIRHGHGLAVVDPHGDLIEELLGNIPPERVDDVIHFDPADVERPMGLNMLEYDERYPEQKTFVVGEMLKVFDKLYDLKATGGPMFEQYMRNAMILVMDDPASGSTLMEIPRVLADEEFRAYKLSKCKTQVVKDFWEKEAQKAGGEASLANMVPYITSKLTPFIANDVMRPIISQQQSAFNVRQAMDENKILLINLSKGKIGDLNAELLGLVLVSKIQMAALSRADMAESARKDFMLYIDEFQNFVTDSVATILSEARKYKLDLVIAHQYIGQLVKNNNTLIKDAVFGNVGTMLVSRIGPEDVETFEKIFAPTFNGFDLMNSDKLTWYCKMIVDNSQATPFTLNFHFAPRGNRERMEQMKQLSRLRYGRDRELVEAELQERSQIGGGFGMGEY